jgi:hypothetical protein
LWGARATGWKVRAPTLRARVLGQRAARRAGAPWQRPARALALPEVAVRRALEPRPAMARVLPMAPEGAERRNGARGRRVVTAGTLPTARYDRASSGLSCTHSRMRSMPHPCSRRTIAHWARLVTPSPPALEQAVTVEDRLHRADRCRLHIRIEPSELFLIFGAPQLGLSCFRRTIRVSIWKGSWSAWR